MSNIRNLKSNVTTNLEGDKMILFVICNTRATFLESVTDNSECPFKNSSFDSFNEAKKQAKEFSFASKNANDGKQYFVVENFKSLKIETSKSFVMYNVEYQACISYDR